MKRKTKERAMTMMIRFELRKIFADRLTKIAVTAVLLLSVFYSFATYQNMYAFDGITQEGTGRKAVEIDQSIAGKYAGILTDEKVRQMMTDFKPTQDLHGVNAAYFYENAVQSALFYRFSDSDGNWNGLKVSDVFGGEEIRIGYIYGWLATSRNMVQISIVLSLIAAIMTAPVFSGEYGGADAVILSSRYGKTKCPTAKIIAGISAAMIVTAAVLAVNLAGAFVLYGAGGLDCSILFAPAEFAEWYIPFNITCGTLLKYQILLAFTGTAGVTGITLVLSALCGKPMTAFAASAAVYLFPVMLPVAETSPLFRVVALLPLYHAQFVALMSVEQMEGGLLYAVWAVPAAIVLFGLGSAVSHRIFAGHQV